MMMMATPSPGGGGLGGDIGAAKVVQAHHRDSSQGWKLNPGGGRDVKGGALLRLIRNTLLAGSVSPPWEAS
jgi:hypothetical protein